MTDAEREAQASALALKILLPEDVSTQRFLDVTDAILEYGAKCRRDALASVREAVLKVIAAEAHQGADRHGDPCYCEEVCQVVHMLYHRVFAALDRLEADHGN